MLTQMRGFTRSWISYLLLFVLMVAFAIWGINDVFNGVGSQNLAEVGSRTVTPAQLTRELELTLRGERQQSGRNVTQQEAIDAGIHLRLLEGIIARHAVSNYAEKLGVSASNTQVAERIREIPAARNPVTGAFDAAAYDNFLTQLRYSRTEFEEDIRGEITRGMLMDALVAGVRAPSSFGALGVSYEGESRIVSVAMAQENAIGAIPAPTQAQLQMFWEESQEALTLPEFRALTLVYARPQDFVSRVEVPEARLREEFEARRAALSRPERRTYVRMSAQNEAQANDAAARITRGESPDAVAAALGLQVARAADQARGDITDARVAEAVFSMAARSVRAVRGELTPWVVVRIEAITPATAPEFASMRDDLRQAIAADEAAEMLNDAVTAFEDARAGGASVADAARQQGLAVVSIPAVEAQGHDASGAEVAALEGQAELLRTAFQTEEGEASEFMPVGDADVIVAVDRVTPSRVRPLEEVRETLAGAWVARERGRRLRELGAELIQAVQGGQTLAQAARANRFEMAISSQPLTRREAAQIPARGLSAQIFAAAEGAAVSDMRADGGAVLVAVVEHINRVDLAAQPQAVEATRAEMQQGIVASFASALQSEIVERARVQRNERLLNSTYRQTGSGEEEEDAAQ